MGITSDIEQLLGSVRETRSFSVRLATPARRVVRREGLLLHGPHGWAEWSPFDEYPDGTAAVWLLAALRSACCPPPDPVRTRVAVNALIPAVSAEHARRLVARSGCTSVKVKVAAEGRSVDEEAAVLAAVRSEIGQRGNIRLDANAAWSLPEALDVIPRLEEAAGGLEYVEQPCASLADLSAVREITGVRVAADESIRLQGEKPASLRGAVDIAIVKVQPLGGVSAALSLAASVGIPVVVSSALETSVGLAAGVFAAASLKALPFACGLGTALLLADDVVDRSLIPAEGAISVEDAATVARSGPSGVLLRPTRERTRWWRQRFDRCQHLLLAESCDS